MPIPLNDIKIDSKKLKTNLIDRIDKIDINNIIKNIVIKEVKSILDSNYFWYEITGTNICAYKYQFSKKKDGHICGKAIHSKHENIEYGTFLCSKHLKTHKVERPRKLKENQIQCKATTIANTQCLYSSKIDGYCNQHYKCIYKTNIKEIHKLIKNKKDKTLKIKPLKENNNQNGKNIILETTNIGENINKTVEKVDLGYTRNGVNVKNKKKLKKKNNYYDNKINKKIKINLPYGKNKLNNILIDNLDNDNYIFKKYFSSSPPQPKPPSTNTTTKTFILNVNK